MSRQFGKKRNRPQNCKGGYPDVGGNGRKLKRTRPQHRTTKTTALHPRPTADGIPPHPRPTATATATTTATTTANGERQRQRQRQRHTTPPAPAPAKGSPLRGDRSPSANLPSALAEWERCLTTLQRGFVTLRLAEVSSATRPQPFRLRSAGAGAATTARPQRPPQPHPQRQRKTTKDDANGTENEKERHLKQTQTTTQTTKNDDANDKERRRKRRRTALTEQKTGATPQFSALSPNTHTNHSNKTTVMASRLTPSRHHNGKTTRLTENRNNRPPLLNGNHHRLAGMGFKLEPRNHNKISHLPPGTQAGFPLPFLGVCWAGR